MTSPDAGDIESPALGAYGLRLKGVEGARALLVEAPPTWPELELERSVGRSDRDGDRLDSERAGLRLRDGGEVLIERNPLRARYRLPVAVSDEELVHPYLAPVAAVAAYWHGFESLHAGAFCAGDGAWGLIGDREAGKSSTLAWLADRGRLIVCDDVLVVAGAKALAGPRTIDLRPEAAALLGVGEEIGVVGARERWRLRLESAPLELPLRGWIFLAWGDTVSLRPLSGGDRVRRLAEARALRVPPTDPGVLLRLAAVPALELRRPPDWSSLPEAAELLLRLE